MKIILEMTPNEFELGMLGATRLGYKSFGEALVAEAASEPDALMDMVTAMAKEQGVPVPPPHAIARAIAPVVREELARMRREAERARQRKAKNAKKAN